MTLLAPGPAPAPTPAPPPAPATEIAARAPARTARRLAAGAAAGAGAVALLGLPRVLGLVGDAMIVLFLVYLVRHLLFLAVSGPAPKNSPPPPPTAHSATVVVPCRDEELVVHTLVGALDRLQGPGGGLQVIVIDDRSTDRTPALLDAAAAVRPGWTILHRRPGATPGKSAALNDALALAVGDVIVVFDADHRPDADCVRRLVSHFADPVVAAAQGRCLVGNPRESPLARLVALDYLCGYLVNMVGRARAFGLPAYGGANCAVRASVIRGIGGWNEASVTEDTDLTLRVVLAGFQVRYDAAAVDVEQGVSTLGRFWRQRYRWARGHQQVCAEQRLAVLRSRRLGPLRKLETLLFLFGFHIPVVCLLAAVLVGARVSGLVTSHGTLDPWPLIPLMLAGPLLEIGGGLIAAGVRRRRALDLLLFPVLYVVSMGVCTKALLDRTLGRGYGWHKTVRSAQGA